MFLIAEEEVSWFDILMKNTQLVTICQSSSTLQSYTAELVHIAIQLVIGH